MRAEKYINYLIEEAESSFKTLRDATPFPSITIQKKHLKRYNCKKLQKLAEKQGWSFMEMVNAPEPFTYFPEEFKIKRYVMFKAN